MAAELKRNTPRDVFLHLLAIITLYWSSVSFITLLWQFVNHFFPDLLRQNYNLQYYLEPMRIAVASLIIVFPVYILVSFFLNRNYQKNSAIREMKLRKWLIYFTLFIAAIVIITDLVMVILNLLQGDTTLRFILKALAVLFVAAVVFAYYLDDVRRDKPSKNLKYYVFAVAGVVLIAIVGSFFVIGSPKEARLIQQDQQIVSNLQSIQSEIVNYWQKKEKLPNSLSDLNDPISGFVAPSQPAANYEYNIKDANNLTFELCAVFNKEGGDMYGQIRPETGPSYGYAAENWQHPAGRFCFERTIDKQLYPPLIKTK